MIQFYFLSILLNLLAGLIFIYAVKDSLQSDIVPSDSDDSFFHSSESDDLDFDSDQNFSDVKSNPEKSQLKSLALPFLGDKTLQLVVGILSALTGLMKLLSPIQFDVPVVGDLIPALTGLVSGAVLLLDWYQTQSGLELPLPLSIQNVYTNGRKYLGIFCVIAATLHFIFPRVLFL